MKPFLKKYGKARRAEIDKVVGDHLTDEPKATGRRVKHGNGGRAER
jgi:hypothetical protein